MDRDEPGRFSAGRQCGATGALIRCRPNLASIGVCLLVMARRQMLSKAE
jgi:hypothetical protein